MSAPTLTAAPSTERVAAAWFALQAVLGVVLWIGIGTSDVVREAFDLVPARAAVTDAFFLADMVVVATSAVAAWALVRRRRWALVAVGATVGGVVYPTAYLLSWVRANDGDNAVALAVMLMTSVLSCWAAYLAWRALGPDGGTT